jgi:hypothetical protein
MTQPGCKQPLDYVRMKEPSMIQHEFNSDDDFATNVCQFIRQFDQTQRTFQLFTIISAQLRLPPFRAPPANFLNLIDIIVRAALLACNLKEKKPISIWEVLGVIGGGIALLALISQDKNLNLSKLVERVFGLGTISRSNKKRLRRK